MIQYLRSTLIKAHEHATNNKESLEKSKICGCFYCFEVYDPKEILEDNKAMWIDVSTAFCAKCGIDSVIGDASGFPVDDELFLELMGFVWFNGYAQGHDQELNYYALKKKFEINLINDVDEPLF